MDSKGSDLQINDGRHWLSISGDFILVGASLALATWLLSSDDPLWLRWNPSPLILVPLLLGGRYGLVVGIVCGLLTAGIGVSSAVLQGFGSWNSVVYDYRYLLAALPILGLVAGELRSALVRTQTVAAKEVAALKEANLLSTSALHVAEESAHRLERQLAVHGLELVSFDNELATILKADDRKMYRETLSMLYRVSGLQAAAIYLPQNGSGHMRRVATLEYGSALPEELPIDEGIVERALITRDLVTCREIWEVSPEQKRQWIAALPWVDHVGNVVALLMVQRMALLSINWQDFDRMKTVCQWVTCCRLVNAGTHVLSDAEARTFRPAWDGEVESPCDQSDDNLARLHETVRLCVRGRELHQLSTVGLCFPGAGLLLAESGSVHQSLSKCLRPQDVFASDPDSDRLMILLPMIDLDGAKVLAESILRALRAECSAHGIEAPIEYSSAMLKASEPAEVFLERLLRRWN